MIITTITQIWDKKSTCNTRSNRIWKVKVKVIGDQKKIETE